MKGSLLLYNLKLNRWYLCVHIL